MRLGLVVRRMLHVSQREQADQRQARIIDKFVELLKVVESLMTTLRNIKRAQKFGKICNDEIGKKVRYTNTASLC